jgi:hypothetical protein
MPQFFVLQMGAYWPSNVQLTTKAGEENKGLIASEDITELLARILIARDALAKMIDKLDDTYAQLIGVRSPNDPMVQADRRPLKEGADLKFKKKDSASPRGTVGK